MELLFFLFKDTTHHPAHHSCPSKLFRRRTVVGLDTAFGDERPPVVSVYRPTPRVQMSASSWTLQLILNPPSPVMPKEMLLN